jgi:hypothetical protein
LRSQRKGLSAPSAVPLPSTLLLFATGLALMGWLAWHQRRKAAALFGASA